jgi:hypothetical protein
MIKNVKGEVEIIFCGLIRNKPLFKKSIKELSKLKERKVIKNIFLSTWDYEIKNNPEIVKFLKDRKIKIIVNNEPKERGFENVWCQMKTFESGLNTAGKNNFILRTRPDVYISSDFLERLFENKEKLLKINFNLPKGNLFKYKIFVPWVEVTKPFYIDDSCIFGHSVDLRLLINYDKSYDSGLGIGKGITHIRKFIHPFLKDYPYLKTTLGKYKDEIYLTKIRKIIKPNRFKILRNLAQRKRFFLLKNRLSNEVYLKNLATYYLILHSHFYIKSSETKNQFIFRNHYLTAHKLKLNEKIFENNFTKKKTRPPSINDIYLHDPSFIDAIFKDKFKKTSIYLRFKKVLNSLYQ